MKFFSANVKMEKRDEEEGWNKSDIHLEVSARFFMRTLKIKFKWK